MLDTFVLTQLEMWASWKARKFDNGQGYPKKSAFINEPSGGFWTPEMDSQCVDVDKAVCALLPERREAIIKQYTVTATKEQKAKMCGCSINTYKMRLSMAYRDILGFLNDLACGIPLQNNAIVEANENILNLMKKTA